MNKENKYLTRSPTLNTVLMVEETIEKYSGEYKKKEMWQKLPKKVMWQTYSTVIEYLESINKISWGKDKRIAYIWNPKLTKILSKRPEIKLQYEKLKTKIYI